MTRIAHFVARLRGGIGASIALNLAIFDPDCSVKRPLLAGISTNLVFWETRFDQSVLIP